MSLSVISPRSRIEALTLLRDLGKEYLAIAGGTNVLVDLSRGKLKPSGLVDLSMLEEWKLIRFNEDKSILEIGSLVTHAKLEEHPLIKQFCPALSMAASVVGSPQIRNRGTVAGNLQSASPAADCAPPLLAYDSVVTLLSISGTQEIIEREIPLTEFFLGPGQTALIPGELISKISIKVNPREKSLFLKAGLRKALAISLVNLAVSLELDEDRRCLKARVALGSVAPTPIRVREVEEFLQGRVITQNVLEKAGQIVDREIFPISDIRGTSDYRRNLARILLEEALRTLTGAKEGETWPSGQ